MGKRLALLVLAFGIVGCARSAGGDEPAGLPDEVAKLKGTWTGSVLLGDAPGGDVTVEFTAGTVKFTHKNGRSFSRPYSIDPTQTPKWIDFKEVPKSDPPLSLVYGIYEIDGDKLKICMGAHGKRPSKFGGGYGTVIGYYVLKRK